MNHDAVPRFSNEEHMRRRSILEAATRLHEVDAVLVYGRDRSGSAVQWLCEWPVTREAALIVSPDEVDELLVQFYNHLPQARRMAAPVDVRWGGVDTVDAVIETLDRRNSRRVGVIGPLGWQYYRRLSDRFDVVGMDADYRSMRLVKSPEELEVMKHAARLSDSAIEAIGAAAAVGATDAELGAACEAAYLSTGATNHIHYFAITSMTAPDRCVPSQWPTGRRVEQGSVITCEISASWRGYAGQVLRTMAVGSEPTDQYRRLHEVAEEAYHRILDVLRPGATPQQVVDASSVIEEAGFTIYDDLVHGYGGGYWPPVLGTRSRTHGALPDLVFEEGMTVVVQPNVITPDEAAGVQTGGLVAISSDGVEELQKASKGLWVV